ncbi:hypothetical protein ODJ79_35575 [Actinoplanes sp. KI2]|uniref:hypothetical protein n=1 Tax=Actinoplanes sp. KI2 TaxID=2983315 RepID=UPI0021D5732B|nr:hypothetical protein [Actinoplanes sp. KI2]MCU7729064.1 hypothetical protein [Actinoplanes sp. KI2]
MSLTGIPLIACAVLATAAALAATILIWNRWRRLRLVLRPAGVLLTEALLVVSVGLMVNRSEEFYPDWAALMQSNNSAGTTYAVHPGGLDGWLRGQSGDLADQGSAFPWQPADWTSWHLAGAPLVFTPAGYLKHTGWRYPTLLVLDDGKNGWTPDGETAAARSADTAAGPAVVVFARTTPATSIETLTTAMPAALAHDLRVTDRRWALVAPAADTGLADKIVAAAPGRYPALALVQAKPATGKKPATKPASKPKTAAKLKTVTKPKRVAKPKTAAKGGKPRTTVAGLPAGITTTTIVETALTSTGPAVPPAETALASALDWACGQTPPPLAASTPAATSLPVYHPHHGAKHPSPGSSGAVPPGGGVSKPRGGQRVAR